jgi:hypothetical protein
MEARRRWLRDGVLVIDTCAVGPCHDPRADGSLYCPAHGPRISAKARRVSTDAQIRCPHCEVRGQVTTKRVRRRAGISGGKPAAALLTGGLSLPFAGLSRMENRVAAKCGNCDVIWTI